MKWYLFLLLFFIPAVTQGQVVQIKSMCPT